VMDNMFPEIKNPLLSQAQVRAERAMKHPKAILVDQIISYRKQAKLLRDTGNPEDLESAKLYEELAKSLEAEMKAVAQPAGPAGPQAAPTTVDTPLTREVRESAEDLGRT
ncbi:hypothetical protein LCGC14_2065890, partial [marine sediment metagenome]